VTLESLKQRINKSRTGFQKNHVLFGISEYDVLGFRDQQILELLQRSSEIVLQTLLLLEVLGGKKIGAKYVKSFIIIEPIF